MIKVEYEVLEPVLDFRKALDNEVVVHPEEDWEVKVPISPDVKRNLICHDVMEEGDVEAEFEKCKYVIEETYLTKANQQTMMETLEHIHIKIHMVGLFVLQRHKYRFMLEEY